MGGKIVRLHHKGPGYFYFAHLSDWNDEDFSSGDKVVAGDVIGYCGNTGNAHATAPHVHFGWYVRRVARDPYPMLKRWLHRAERRASRLQSKKKKQIRAAERRYEKRREEAALLALLEPPPAGPSTPVPREIDDALPASLRRELRYLYPWLLVLGAIVAAAAVVAHRDVLGGIDRLGTRRTSAAARREVRDSSTDRPT